MLTPEVISQLDKARSDAGTADWVMAIAHLVDETTLREYLDHFRKTRQLKKALNEKQKKA